MLQEPENIYADTLKSKLNNSSQHKEIYLEYPFSPNKDIEKPFLIKELAGQWISDIKNTLRPSSYACYQNNIEKYILPYIGEMPASTFNADILSRLLDFIKKENSTKKKMKNEEPFSQYTLYLLENIVRAMFRYGTENNLTPEIFFGKAEYKVKSKKEALPLSDLEIHQLLNIVKMQETDIQLQILLPLYTGISLSELCGLKWEDIDLENGKIHIHRNLVRIQQRTEILKKYSKSNKDSIDNKTNADSNEKFTDSKESIKIQAATILTECELPENECRKFIIPEKLYNLLKEAARNNPSKESYVAEVNKKSGRKKQTTIEKAAKKTKYTKTKVKEIIKQKEDIKFSPPDGRTLQYRLKNTGEMAWIEELNYQRIRDTFAVMCLQAGGDAYSIAYVMGVGPGAICDRYREWMVRSDGFLRGIK